LISLAAPWERRGVQIHTRASVVVPRPVEAVFDFATSPSSFPAFMKPRAPIPGVSAVNVDGDGVTRAGATRRVAMSDGSTMGEEVLEHERPRRHAYRWMNPPRLPFSLLVRGARAAWSFAPEGAGTRIDWSYSFELTTPLVYPLGALVVKLFQGWMLAGLRGIEGAMPRTG
jgi:hypothetical protein